MGYRCNECIPNCRNSKRFVGHKPRHSLGRRPRRPKSGATIWNAPDVIDFFLMILYFVFSI